MRRLGEGLANAIGESAHFPGVGVFAGCPVPVMPIGGEAGDDVEMEVGDDLAGGLAVGLRDIDPVGPQTCDLGTGDLLDDGDEFLEDGDRGFGDGIVVGFGNDNGMAFDNRADIHERQNVVILIDLRTGDVSLHNFAEDAIRTHGNDSPFGKVECMS